MATFYVCSKVDNLNNEKVTPLKLEDDDCDDIMKLSVGKLLAKVVTDLKLTQMSNDYQLICFGRKLDENRLISHYGIKSNAVVYLFRKNLKEGCMNSSNSSSSCDNGGHKKGVDKGKKKKFEQQEITNMVVASRTALVSPAFRKMLIKMNESDFRDNLVQCTPGLKDDPIALAVLHDPDLLSTMVDMKFINNVIEKHPSILEAITYLATAFHEETSGPRASTSGGLAGMNMVSYSLDDLSDDEELSGALVEGPPPDGQHVMSPTTASAFAHLLRSSTGNTSNNANPLITTEMLRRALQFTTAPQSLNSSSNANSNEPSNSQSFQQQQNQFPTPSSAMQTQESSPTQSAPTESRPDLSQQLQQMRDLGINDVNLCMQALYATNGDVQAAVNLIFNDNFQP
ncbi:ubiquitin-like protein 7 [Brevipalpus obovatus]|uniref:ubiquitin-like protein 7 n=1 Tax=Brevipalpus obovatus TaxID=246614 RepID=UPI003D9E25A6